MGLYTWLMNRYRLSVLPRGFLGVGSSRSARPITKSWAGRERPARAGDHGGPDVGVCLHLVEGVEQVADHLVVDCVQLLRAIERQVRHPIADLEQYGVCQDFPPSGQCLYNVSTRRRRRKRPASRFAIMILRTQERVKRRGFPEPRRPHEPQSVAYASTRATMRCTYRRAIGRSASSS